MALKPSTARRVMIVFWIGCVLLLGFVAFRCLILYAALSIGW